MPAVPAPPDRFNFAAHLLASHAGRAGKVAYVDDWGALTYGELTDRVRRFATGLGTLGLRREERLLLILEDCVDWPVVFLGALHAGVVPVAVSTMLTADDYAFMLAHSRAQAVVTSGPLLATVSEALARGDHEVRQVMATRPAAPLAAGVRTVDDVIAGAAAAERAAATHRDDVAFWLYSSGSTGRPKAVLHTHANPYWTAQLYGQTVLGMREDDVVFSASKLFFAYGLGNAVSFPLSIGATVILMAERATPAAVAARLTRHRPTVLCGAPTGYAALLASPALPARDATALRLCSSAGEALPAALGQRVAQHFAVDVIDGMGSTEMLHIFLSNRPGDVRYGTAGKPVRGYDVELRDGDGRPVGTGEAGDLYVKGPSAALAYWCDRDRSRATFQGEWVKTGDRLARDADGYYVCVGRSDDMIKVSGVYVSPLEVEAVLAQHPAVLEAAVVGVEDGDGLTKPKAFVVVQPGRTPTDTLAAELQAFVKQRLAPHKYPRAVAFLAELPKTATGKIQRFRLREMSR